MINKNKQFKKRTRAFIRLLKNRDELHDFEKVYQRWYFAPYTFTRFKNLIEFIDHYGYQTSWGWFSRYKYSYTPIIKNEYDGILHDMVTLNDLKKNKKLMNDD